MGGTAPKKLLGFWDLMSISLGQIILASFAIGLPNMQTRSFFAAAFLFWASFQFSAA